MHRCVRSQTAVIAVRNDGAYSHGIRVNSHQFLKVSGDGEPGRGPGHNPW